MFGFDLQGLKAVFCDRHGNRAPSGDGRRPDCCRCRNWRRAFTDDIARAGMIGDP
jgi:hypothetical protein